VTEIQLPPPTRAVGQGNPPADMNEVITALLAMGAVTYVTPSGDATGAGDSASIAAALALSGSQGCVLAPGTFYLSGPAQPDTGQIVAGCGYHTIVQPGSAFSGSYLITLKTPASSVRTTIRDLLLSINWASGVGGVQIDNTGYTDPGGATGLPDTLHTLDNILVVRPGGDGFHFDNNAREMHVKSCRVYNGLGYGFYLGDSGGAGSGCTDSRFVDCGAGNGALHGWYVLDGNNMFTACKAFGSGFNDQTDTWGTTGCGFELSGSHCVNNVFTSCSAQQNALHGFDLQSCAQVTTAGCEADSNGAGASVTTGCGVNVNASANCSVTGTVGSQSITPGAQLYGLEVTGTCTGTWLAFNACSGTGGTFHDAGSTGRYIMDGPDITDLSGLNQFRVGRPVFLEAGSAIALSNGSNIGTSATDGTYALTATGAVTGITMGTAGAEPGSFVTLVNTSVYTVTFAASGTSHVADGTADVIAAGQAASYIWDNTTSLWYRLAAPATALAASVSYTPADPTGNATGTFLMMGLGTTCTFTPATTGKVEVTMCGVCLNTGGDGTFLKGAYGTGTAPVNGAASTGTKWGVGADSEWTIKNASASQGLPFSMTQVLTLTPGTAYWFDLPLAESGGGTSEVTNIVCSLRELAS
jgi:hypothetical protein